MDGMEDSGLTRFLRAYDPHQPIFREGEPGDFMYVVKDGQVNIVKEAADGPIALAVMGQGEFFGEMALVDRSSRSATAIAGDAGVRLLAIDSAHFVYLVSQQPAFALVVLEVMASRLRTNNQKWEAKR